MTAVLEQITVSGVYDIPAEVYHADPVAGGSLSSSGARTLLDCPARFQYERQHGRPPTRAFDFGHAAHREVLGAGAELVVVPYPDWRTAAARQMRDDAYVAGRVPLLEAEHRAVQDMAASLRANRFAAAALHPDRGLPERTLVWRDSETDVWCRAMVDWLRPDSLVDYKTADSVATDHIARAVARYGYHQQAAWYLDGAASVGHGADIPFLFVFQEKHPPYLARVVELDQDALLTGRERNRRALAIYRDCAVTDVWPAYPDEITTITLPRWAHTEEAPLD